MPGKLALYLRTSSGTGASVSTRLPDDWLGLHIGRHSPTSIYNEYFAQVGIPTLPYTQTPVPNVPFAALRSWDSEGCTWRGIERSKGSYHWDRLDYLVALGKQVMWTGGCPPDWATAPAVGQVTAEHPGLAGNYVGYNPHPPSNMQDWHDFLTAIMTRYGSAIQFWEPLNEVNDRSAGLRPDGTALPGVGFTGTVAQGIAMSAIMFERAKTIIGPSAIVLTPNFTGSGLSSGQSTYSLDAHLAAGGAAYADAVAFHGYSDEGPQHQPESILSLVETVRGIMRGHGVNKPLINSEWGIDRYIGADGQAKSVGDNGPLSAQRAKATMARKLLCNMMAGVAQYYIFQADWNLSADPIVDLANPATLLPASAALAYLMTLVAGGTRPARVREDSRYYCCRFRIADGRTVMAYWLVDYPQNGVGLPLTVSIPMPAGVAQLRDVVGAAQTVGPTLGITGSPQYLFFGD